MRFLSILPFLGILIVAAAAAVHSKRRIELTMPLCVFSLALIVYFPGLLDDLRPGLYVCWAVILASLGYLIYRMAKRTMDWKRVLTPGFFFVIAVYAFGLFVHRKETLIGWDESAHWILTLRNSFVLNRFGAVAPSSAQYKTYPPIAAMFHYFFTKTSIVYANTTVRMSVTVLEAMLLAPLLCVFGGTKRSRVYAAVCGVILFALPFVYFKNAYFGTQVDCLQGLALAAILSIYFLTDGDRLGVFTACTGLAFLALTKDSGQILALIAAAVLAFDRLFFFRAADPVSGRRRLRISDCLLALLLLALPLLSKLSWTVFLHANDIAEEAADQLDFWMIDYVKAIVSGRFREDYARSYRVEGFQQFWRSVAYDASFHENTRFHIAGLTVPYSVRLVFSALLMALAVWRSEQRKRTGAALLLLYLGNLVWLIGISVLYLCRFTEPENAVLSSVSRYLGTGLIAMDVFSLSLLCRPYAKMIASDGRADGRKRILAVVIAALLTLPSLSVLFSQEAYENYKGRPLLCFAQTPLDAAYDTYTSEYRRIGTYLTEADSVLIVAEEREHDTLWYKHTLPPLQLVYVIDAAHLQPGQEKVYTKMYVFSDMNAATVAKNLGLPAGSIESGALYGVVQNGTAVLERLN